MKDSLEQLLREEQELERRMSGAPKPDETTEGKATGSERDTEVTPTEGDEQVSHTPKSVTDEPYQTETEDWEKRYKNLRSSRDQKLYEAKAQLSAALHTINTLQTQIDQLRTAAPKVDPLAGVFTDEDTENLGEATVDAMKRVTAKATEAATRDLRQQLEEERKLRQKQQQELQKSSQQDAYGIFISRVANAVPNWEEINFDPNFKKFMEEEDLDGTPRKTYFAQAEAQGNSALIIRYMKEYEASKPAPKVDKLADKVTPTGEGTGATQVEDNKDKGKISRSFITKFYDDLTRGKYDGRHSEAQAIERRIDEAVVRGDIIP